MTTAFTQPALTRNQGTPQLPTLPNGWPIGSYGSYEGAQQAVDHLAGNEFPVTDVTIVGVEPMLVERVTGKLTRGRMLGGGAMSGAWFGLLIGLILSMVNPGAGMLAVLIGLGAGVACGLASSALGYFATKQRRGFLSHSQLVATRYDVICLPRNAEKGRDLLAQLAMRTSVAG